MLKARDPFPPFEYSDPFVVMATALSGAVLLGVDFLFLLNAPDLSFFFLGLGAIYLSIQAGYREYKIRKLAKELNGL